MTLRLRPTAWRGARRHAGAPALLATLAAAALASLAPFARAQAQAVATEGALFLLLPVGARAIALGQAVAAGVDGSEAVWWNAAGLARQEKRELSIHHAKPFLGTDQDVITLVVPSSLLGVMALSANIVDLGTDEQRGAGNQFEGDITTRAFIFAGSYATAVGTRFNAGIGYKLLLFRVSCSPACEPGIEVKATTSAVDFGAQYDLRGFLPVTVGLAVRNLGLSLQVNDNPQRDALPARVQAGVRWRAAPLERRAPETEIAITADVLRGVPGRYTSFLTGVDATWRKRASLRAGYVLEDSEARGPAIGVGVRQGNLLVDLAYQFSGAVEITNADPMVVSVRFLF